MRNTIILFLLFLILLAFVLFSSDIYHETEEAVSDNKTGVLEAIDRKKVFKVELIKSEKKVVLKRYDDLWKVIEPLEADADQEAVNSLLKGIENIRFQTLISSNKKKRARFNVDEAKGLKVTVYSDNSTVLIKFIIGKSTPDFNHTYVRKDGSDDVYWAKGFKRYQFDKGVRMWRDSKILFFKKEDLKEIALISKGSKIVFEKGEKGWMIKDPVNHSADKNSINTIINVLSNFIATEFEDELDTKAVSLDSPELTILVKLADGREETVLVGKEKGGNRYVKNKKKRQIFLVPKIRIDSMTKSVSEYKAKEDETD